MKTVTQKNYPLRFNCLFMIVLVLFLSSQVFAKLTRQDIEKLREQGKREGWTFRVGENDATKYDIEEITGAVLPTPEQRARIDAELAKKGTLSEMLPSDSLPSYFDWRDSNACTPVRNQGGCGSCWAFAAIGAVEGAIVIMDGVNPTSLDLSEQWLVSCTNAGDCGGGMPMVAYEYLIPFSLTDPCGDVGAVLESDFSYLARNAPCKCPYPHYQLLERWDHSGDDVASIKTAIYNYGPVAVYVYVGPAWNAYTDGIFNAYEEGELNHCVVLTGWDDSQGANGIWFLKNSWGEGWGEDGYMRTEYGCNDVGALTSYPTYFPAANLKVVPESSYNFTSYPGQAPVINNQGYIIQNNSGASFNWTVSDTADWLDVAPNNGTLGPDEVEYVYITGNSEAENLPIGTYYDTITITDTTNSIIEQRTVELTVRANQLLGYWKLDETSGLTASDSTGNGFDGVCAAGLSFDNDSVSGHFDNALDFDGVDDFVSIPALNLFRNEVTITAWLKRDGTQAAWAGIVMCRGGDTDSGLNLGNLSELRYHWDNSASTWGWDSGLVVPDGTWTFCALVVEPTQATIYMDSGGGMQSATNYVTHVVEEFNGVTYIGLDAGDRLIRGAVDDVRFYNYALSSAEVLAASQSVYQPDTSPPTPDPMTWETVPYAVSSSSIAMVATTATDASGVEYYFTCTAGGGNDSGWQSSPTYEDTGLQPETQYTYTVKARDMSLNQYETAASTAASATTMAAGSEPDMYVNDIAMSSRRGGQTYYGRATVWIKDDTGANVEQATVYGDWSGAVNAPDSGITLTDGTVMIESPGVKGGGTFTFTVTDVVKSGYIYNASLNVETSDSVTAP